eukprot:2666351-Amphidinium_carterae.1
MVFVSTVCRRNLLCTLTALYNGVVARVELVAHERTHLVKMCGTCDDSTARNLTTSPPKWKHAVSSNGTTCCNPP